MFEHLVRVGCLGQVGRFSSVETRVFARGTRVVCRTSRGVEVGEVLSSRDRSPAADRSPVAQLDDGQILRRVTVEDDLLLARLARHARSAFDACSQLLRERGLHDLLIDVEHLFDGQSIYFYFLGAPSPQVERLTHELASTYEARAQIGKFAELLAAGCGPDCGTEDAAGCGSHGCSTCAVAAACGK